MCNTPPSGTPTAVLQIHTNIQLQFSTFFIKQIFSNSSKIKFISKQSVSHRTVLVLVPARMVLVPARVVLAGPVLQQDAGPLAGGGLRVEEGPHGLHEHVLDAVLVQGRALQVAEGVDLAGERGALLVADGRLVLLLQLPLGVGVVPEVALCADQQDGDVGTMVRHLTARTALNV